MEGLLILLLIILVAGIFILPFVAIVKMSSFNQKIDFLNHEISDLSKEINGLRDSALTKDDANEIVAALNNLKGQTLSIVRDDVQEPEAPKKEDITESPAPLVEEVVVEEKTLQESEEWMPEKAAVSTVILETQEPVTSVTGQEEPVVAPEEEEPALVFSVDKPVKKTQSPVIERVTSDKNLIEKVLGDNWLSKVGIVTLVLGISFFVKYAIDQNWINEIGRVGIGILTGGLIIGIAHKLQSKYQVFSSILVGGGISVLYITITLAYREYGLINQTLAFVILIAITLFSVILSILYDKKELAVFSMLGGFSSPLLASSGTGNYVVLFSYILILNTGMLVLSFVKRWKILGIISYALTLLFFWTWALRSFNGQFAGATVFVALFFVQFYLLAIFDHFKSKNKLTAYQVFLILTNNLSAFLACLYLFHSYMYDVKGLITIVFAVVNTAVMLGLFRKSKIDRNLTYMLIAIVLSFVSLAVPIQLHGHAITMFWAAETVVLLWLWQRSQIKVFRLGFTLISVLVLISYVMDIHNHYLYGDVFPASILLSIMNVFHFSRSYVDLLPLFTNRIFITGLVVTVAFVINKFLLRREKETSDIFIGKLKLIASETLIKVFHVLVIVLVFMVPYLELGYQLRESGATDIIYLALATYTTVYVAALGLIYRKRLATLPYVHGLLALSFVFYTVVYSLLAIEARYDIFQLGRIPASYFLIHLISLPAITYIVFLLVKELKRKKDSSFVKRCWALVIMSVIILSVEADHLVIQCLGNASNYGSLLYDMHTFGYPILWGLIAMVLMVWGLNRRVLILRKISLLFFGLIILKFYAYDVWRMSQTGRIVSFIMLGVILLSVSFLQQKIKTWMTDEKSLEKEEQESDAN